MRWLAASAIGLAACSFSGAAGPAGGADAAPGDGGADAGDVDGRDDLERRKAIVIGGGRTSEALVDFPLYVALIDDDDLRDHAASDGADIFFVDADGETPLDHEIERFDAETGSLIAWVRVPLIDPVDGAEMFLRYGDLEAAVAPDPAGLWQADFAAVFHLNNAPGTPIVDSTGARDGAAHSSMDATNLVGGKLGLGLVLDGGNDVIDFDNPFVDDDRTSEHTISGWVSQDASANNEAFVVLGTGGASNRARFLHTRFFNGTIAVGLYADDIETDDNIQGSGFRLVHWTYNAAQESTVYIDGALASGPSQHNNPADTAGSEGRIGNAPGGASGFGTNMGLNGIIDEVRIVATVRSDAWIAAEFANQNSPASFYAVDPEETR